MTERVAFVNLSTMELHKIRAQNLVKIYGKRTVVNDLSLEINQGEVVGILARTVLGNHHFLYDHWPGQAQPWQGVSG